MTQDSFQQKTSVILADYLQDLAKKIEQGEALILNPKVNANLLRIAADFLQRSDQEAT